MRVGGRLHIATDVEDYPATARAVLSEDRGAWREISCAGCETSSYEYGRPETHYAREAVRKENVIHDMCFILDESGEETGGTAM